MRETCVVRVVCRADGGSPTPHDGRYVVSWNPHTRAGVLVLLSTPDLAKATHFPWPEVFDQWKTISNRQPTRPWDGKPNRPLTGVTIEIIRDTQESQSENPNTSEETPSPDHHAP